MQIPGCLPAGTSSINFHRNGLAGDVAHARSFLSERGYLRVDQCFDDAVAEGTRVELKQDARYARMERDLAGDYGVLHCEGELSPCVGQCCHFLKGPVFLDWLTGLLGSKVCITRHPSPFRMKLGDRIVAHDDCSDYPLNRFSVVLHFSKSWKKQFGGNTVIGEVKRIETIRSEKGESRRHWIFTAKRSVLVPVFNSLVLIALRPGMAHKVTEVRAKADRLTIVATYGLDPT